MGTSNQCRVHVCTIPCELNIYRIILANHIDRRTVEMNVGIIVACVFTFPIFFDTVHMYMRSATASLRTRWVSSSVKESTPRITDLPKDSFLQTHESTNSSMDHENQSVELHDVTPPKQWGSSLAK